MDADEVRRRVAGIRDAAYDPENAHASEDELYTEVLAAIADGESNAADLAAAALKTRDLDFPRWYA